MADQKTAPLYEIMAHYKRAEMCRDEAAAHRNEAEAWAAKGGKEQPASEAGMGLARQTVLAEALEEFARRSVKKAEAIERELGWGL